MENFFIIFPSQSYLLKVLTPLAHQPVALGGQIGQVSQLFPFENPVSCLALPHLLFEKS